jgi:hypothetical protein
LIGASDQTTCLKADSIQAIYQCQRIAGKQTWLGQRSLWLLLLQAPELIVLGAIGGAKSDGL